MKRYLLTFRERIMDMFATNSVTEVHERTGINKRTLYHWRKTKQWFLKCKNQAKKKRILTKFKNRTRLFSNNPKNLLSKWSEGQKIVS